MNSKCLENMWQGHFIEGVIVRKMLFLKTSSCLNAVLLTLKLNWRICLRKNKRDESVFKSHTASLLFPPSCLATCCDHIHRKRAMQSLICVTLMLLTAINVHGQDIKVAVLSPTANQEFYLGEKLFFDYAPLDSNSRYLSDEKFNHLIKAFTVTSQTIEHFHGEFWKNQFWRCNQTSRRHFKGTKWDLYCEWPHIQQIFSISYDPTKFTYRKWSFPGKYFRNPSPSWE